MHPSLGPEHRRSRASEGPIVILVIIIIVIIIINQTKQPFEGLNMLENAPNFAHTSELV